MMSKLNSAKASYGESYLLVSILAAVLGGVNPDGGSGRIIGMVLALFLLQIIESGFNILGISPYLTMALWGTLLLCFIQARGMLGLDRWFKYWLYSMDAFCRDDISGIAKYT